MHKVVDMTDRGWNLYLADILGTSVVLQPGGAAMISFDRESLQAVPTRLLFHGTYEAGDTPDNPKVFGKFRALYAKATTKVTEKMEPDRGVSIILPVGRRMDDAALLEQGRYVEAEFVIYNHSDQVVTIEDVELIRSPIRYALTMDEDGLIDGDRTIYTIELGHVLGNGKFYFNRAYIDEPYYTVANGSKATIEPLTNASDMFIGGEVSGAGSAMTIIVCYCTVPELPPEEEEEEGGVGDDYGYAD